MDSDAQFLITVAALGVALSTQWLNFWSTRTEAREKRRDERDVRLSTERQGFLEALTRAEIAHAAWSRVLSLYVEYLDRPYSEADSWDSRHYEAANFYASDVDAAERALAEELLALGTMVNDQRVWESIDALVAPIRQALATTTLRDGNTHEVGGVLLPKSAEHMAEVRGLIKGARALPLRPAPYQDGSGRRFLPALRSRLARRGSPGPL